MASRPDYSYKPIEATASPEDIFRHGHLAIFLRHYMEETGMRVADFNYHVLGEPRTHTTVYAWVQGRGVPSTSYRRTLSRALGVPEHFFYARELDNGPAIPQPTTYRVPMSWLEATRKAEEPKALVVTPDNRPRASAPPYAPPRPPPRNPPLQFTANPDGTATIKLDVTLPADTGASLLRMLLEAGVHLRREDPPNHPERTDPP